MRKIKTYIRTGLPEYDQLLEKVQGFLEQDVLDVVIDGQKIRGYRSPDAKSIWLRDHSDMMRAAKYFETDLKSTVDHFAANQAANGRIFDYFTTFPEKLPCEKENWTKYVRVPVEADVEFRFIKAAFIAWQASGDDDWIIGLIPAMERALGYIFSNPQRIDAASGLVKRAYTIDTWDFAYTAGNHDWLQFQIDEDTYWGIFHGDNSGYFEALNIMGLLYEYFGDSAPLPRIREGSGEGTFKAEGRGQRAKISQKREELRRGTNEICWNGRFYTHFVKLTPVTIDGVDESEQLSMANPMSINRGLATHEMAVSIIKEYQKRKETTKAFAEWFSIDPPFPDGIFGDDKLIGGAYINGGIFPLAGAELAMAAFNHGFEEYGVAILKQYYQLISEKNETYLWYFPDGTPTTVETSTSPDAMPTDGWGSSAMAWALIEGLAGVEDRLKRFMKIRFSPRWIAAGVGEAEVSIGYQFSGIGYRNLAEADNGGKVHYSYYYSSRHLDIELDCRANVDFHILVASKDSVIGITINGLPLDFVIEWVESSQYINFSANIADRSKIRLNFKG